MKAKDRIVSLEFFKAISDLAFLPFVKGLGDYPAHRLADHVKGRGKGRERHAFRVSYMSYHLARFFGVSSRDCARAGILHDVGYDGRRSVVVNLLTHHVRSASVARNLGESGKIIEMIESHMFPIGNMISSKEGLILWVADKIDSILDLLHVSDMLDQFLENSIPIDRLTYLESSTLTDAPEDERQFVK